MVFYQNKWYTRFRNDILQELITLDLFLVQSLIYQVCLRVVLQEESGQQNLVTFIAIQRGVQLKTSFETFKEDVHDITASTKLEFFQKQALYRIIQNILTEFVSCTDISSICYCQVEQCFWFYQVQCCCCMQGIHRSMASEIPSNTGISHGKCLKH